MHEMADALVPVYTWERWRVFTDLAAWQTDIDEYGAEGQDMTELAGIALYEVARTLLSALIEEDEEEDERTRQDDDESLRAEYCSPGCHQGSHVEHCEYYAMRHE